jgi:transcriptional regulator with GAF, ATPase, and Fis domain
MTIALNLLQIKSLRLSNNLWSGGVQLLWSDDKQSDGFYKRCGEKNELKSVIGIPLIYNDEAIGVLKIGTKKSANYLNNYIRIFQRLEVFIGSELNRKKARK